MSRVVLTTRLALDIQTQIDNSLCTERPGSDHDALSDSHRREPALVAVSVPAAVFGNGNGNGLGLGLGLGIYTLYTFYTFYTLYTFHTQRWWREISPGRVGEV